MASDYQAISYADVAAGTKTTSGTIRWSKVLPMMLLVPIIFGFGTPIFAFGLLVAVLAAPVVVAVLAMLAVQHERSA
ncbi:MAG TPA: hypothetical protein VLT47_14620 [Anaeromyxobacteraceae bacterium]|nr:hypothetical protein [Anaeromyxobacteraceae bacterium]